MQVSREEFERLALEQIDMIDRIARSLTRDSSESDDLVQETYARAIRAWPTFDLREHGIRPWLVRILHNVHVSRRVREGRQPSAIAETDLEAAAVTREAPPPEWDRLENREELRRAMDTLPAELRTALELWAVEEFTYQEMADAFGIPIGTIMSRLHRAKRLLREAYERQTRIAERPASYRKNAAPNPLSDRVPDALSHRPTKLPPRA